MISLVNVVEEGADEGRAVDDKDGMRDVEVDEEIIPLSPPFVLLKALLLEVISEVVLVIGVEEEREEIERIGKSSP